MPTLTRTTWTSEHNGEAPLSLGPQWGSNYTCPVLSYFTGSASLQLPQSLSSWIKTEMWQHWNPGSLLAPIYSLSTGELFSLHCYSSTRTWGWPHVYLPAILVPHLQTYIPNYLLLRVGLSQGFPWGPDIWRRNTAPSSKPGTCLAEPVMLQ